MTQPDSAPALVAGLTAECSQVVTHALTAASVASGLVAAFSTPSMVALMEKAAFEATRPCLAPGQTTVGTDVSIRHLAATPVGMSVRAKAELLRVEGRRLDFAIEAWDDVEKIGEGTHTRMVVDLARFTERVGKKHA